ncbi:unnamed protein product [Parnassius apollo]|uniref:(apollo) hypothetical protein n=1 Tax=Parnassius apollo TaxID=110799 RepID=A0A8S3XPR3_PARAO|nr:unnamed protein product [Parnassius apollo]
MRTLAITMCLVLALAATIAVPIKDVGNDPQSTREKRSPSDWHSEPEGVWKKKLVWQEEWKQIWKTEKKLVWKTVEVPAWKKSVETSLEEGLDSNPP